MQADIIHVMDRGHVIESGSHEELLAAGGRYALSWTQQMRGSVLPSISEPSSSSKAE
jgi:ATP-binding cassette subfamily B protein